MRRYCSVLGLAARCTFWKVLAAALVSCGAEAALFLITLHGWDPELETYGGTVAANNPMGLEGLEGTGSGSQTGYTVRRLRVGESRLTLLWGGYGVLCLVLYWAAHLGTVLALCAAAMPRLAPEAASPLALFLACWRSPYLHALLPLTDWPLLGRNLLLFVGLGLSTASFALRRRHGLRAWSWIPLALAGALFFPMPMSASEWFGAEISGGPFGIPIGGLEALQSLFLSAASLLLIFWSISCIRKGDPDED